MIQNQGWQRNRYRFKFSILLSIISLMVLYVNCTTNEDITGTGSQSGNGRISCVVHNDDGSFASGAKVLLRSHDYTSGATSGKPVFSKRDTYTNKNGEFYLDSIDSGSYNIEVNNGKARAVLLTCEIFRRDTMVQLPEATLLPTGSIKGNCTSAPGDSSELYINVYGIERIAIHDEETGEFIIEDVPAGIYTIRIMSSSSEYTPVQLNNINIDPAGSADVGNIDLLLLSKWLYSKKINLNTTLSGSDISSSIVNFPVLIRLNAENFNFNQANADGSDMRFTKSNGKPLSYEIEQWDASKQEADIWVKLDTVYGNDSTQHFNMYWGNTKASDSSKSWTVFDTADGFRSVWHMGENSKTINDATANHLNGDKKDNVKKVAGNNGYSQLFDGTGDYVDFGNVGNPEKYNFTVCAWIKKSGKNKIQTIISKSTGGKATTTYGWLFQLDADGALSIYMATGEAEWGEPGTFILTSNIWITDTGWHHVAAVINRSDRNDCHVYIDASDVSTYPSAGDIKNIGKLENISPLRIGSDANGNYQWDGSIDDVSIASRLFSHDYIKLMYMNQRINNKLLRVLK